MDFSFKRRKYLFMCVFTFTRMCFNNNNMFSDGGSVFYKLLKSRITTKMENWIIVVGFYCDSLLFTIVTRACFLHTCVIIVCRYIIITLPEYFALIVFVFREIIIIIIIISSFVRSFIIFSPAVDVNKNIRNGLTSYAFASEVYHPSSTTRERV